MRYLITGASSGLGRALALALRKRGHAVVGTTRRIEQAAELAAAYGEKPLGMDFSSLADSTALIRESAENSPFNAIIHCAGTDIVAPLRMTSDEQYRSAMMCADSAFAILRAAASKGVMADGGSIILMSSVAAHRGTAGLVAYGAGKAAIEAMVRSAAVELAPRRIRVNAVAAGAFRSPMHDRTTSRMTAASVDAYAKAHPLGFGPLEAVRDAVLGLLHEPWTTGTVRVVDGGYLA